MSEEADATQHSRKDTMARPACFVQCISEQRLAWCAWPIHLLWAAITGGVPLLLHQRKNGVPRLATVAASRVLGMMSAMPPVTSGLGALGSVPGVSWVPRRESHRLSELK